MQGEGYPTMVCTGTPVGHNDGTAFFKLSFEGGKKDQYWVSRSFSVDYERGVAVFLVARALVEQVGDYVVMTGMKRHRGEKFELNPETLELSGPNFKAKLEAAVTISLPDVKPDGALIPELCGKNALQDEGHPTMVCAGTKVGGHRYGAAFFVLYFKDVDGKKKRQYWVSHFSSADAKKKGVVIYSVARARVEYVHGYPVVTGLMRYRRQKFELDLNTFKLSGPKFKARLEAVGTTAIK